MGATGPEPVHSITPRRRQACDPQTKLNAEIAKQTRHPDEDDPPDFGRPTDAAPRRFPAAAADSWVEAECACVAGLAAAAGFAWLDEGDYIPCKQA